MVKSVRLCAFASCLTLTPAVRVTNNAQADLVEEDLTAPTALTDGVRESEIRHCALFHLQAFEEMVGGCDLPNGADAMTLAIEESADADLALTRADEDSFVAMNTDDIPVDMALCAEGQPFATCASSLPVMLWLRQYWRYQDMSSRLHLTPWERSKTQIFASAINHHGINPSQLHSRCARQIENPAFEVVRQCVLESVPVFVENHTYTDLLYVSTPDGDIVPVQNKEKVATSLVEWLNAMWHRQDLVLGLDDSATSQTRRQCASTRSRLDHERTRYEASIIGAQFPLVGGATQACMEGTPSSLVMSGSLERMIAEMHVCGGGEGANCTEQEHPCPEGFMCDCQRNQREGGALVAGAVLGGVGGLVVATALPFALAGGAGLAVGGAETAMSWAMGSLLIGGKAEVAAAGSAAGTLEISSTCMCFPVQCTFNEESEQCEMVPSQSATPSSNPFATLPSTGLKCTEHHNHHWFQSARVCELAPCEHVDVIPEVRSWGGHTLYGRVGRNPAWDAVNVYNCANTRGSQDSLLSRLSEIPSADGVPVPNTVEGRMDILTAITTR
jgi:hypothetical protein